MVRDVGGNLWKILLFRGASEFMLVAPLMVPFYLANDLTASQFFIIQAAFSAALMVFEVPSGYFSDQMGRRRTLMICGALLALGFGMYAVGAGFWPFLAAEMVLAMAMSLKSGTDSAILFESAEAVGRGGEFIRLEGAGEFWQRVSSGTASVAGGLFALVSLRFPFYLAVIPGLVMLGAAFFMVEPPRKKPQGINPWHDVAKVARQCWGSRSLRAAAMLWGVTLSVGITCIWAYFLRLSEAGIGIGWFGVLFALFQFSSAGGAANSDRLAGWLGEKRVLVGLLAIPLLMVVVAFAPGWAVVPAMFAHAALWGIGTPIFLTQLNREAPEELRATLISVASLGSRLLFVFLAPAFGRVAEVASLQWAFVGLASMALVGLATGLIQMPRRPT